MGNPKGASIPFGCVRGNTPYAKCSVYFDYQKRSGGDAAAVGRPTRGESGPSLFSIELAGRNKGVKLQIVAINKFALESHVVSGAQTAETLYVDRTSAVWKSYGEYLP